MACAVEVSIFLERARSLVSRYGAESSLDGLKKPHTNRNKVIF